MKAKLSRWVLLGAVCAVIARNTEAEAEEVYFSATIIQSPFGMMQGYTVGSVVTGGFDYDLSKAPSATGNNYTDYNLSGMHLDFATGHYDAGSSGLNIAHNVGADTGFEQLNGLDSYYVGGYSLSGPSAQGLRAAACSLILLDTNKSIYAATSPPYPIALPNQDLFEIKQLRVVFLDSRIPIPTEYRVECIVNSIAIVPEPNTVDLLKGGLVVLLLARKRSGLENRPNATSTQFKLRHHRQMVGSDT